MKNSQKIYLKKIYRSLPFKRPVLLFLRNLKLGRLLPKLLKEYLVFEGVFKVRLDKECAEFKINHGYGRQIEASLFWDGVESFEAETMGLWRRLVVDAKVIIDVGANTGIYSLVAQAINPSAEIYGFEPILRVHKALVENINLNKIDNCKGRVQAYRVALSDYNGLGDMYDLPVEHMYTATLNHDSHLERGNPTQSIVEKVSVQRLGDFCAEKNIVPDLIKIDVESHEPAVLRGMADILLEHQPILICEIWNNKIGKEVEEVLDGCNYDYFSIGKSLCQTSGVCNDAPELGYVNYLFISKDRSSLLWQS